MPRDAIDAGFVIDERGHVVTNAHVVDEARSVTVRLGRTVKRIARRPRPVGRRRTA